jgi:hypothetical protein
MSILRNSIIMLMFFSFTAQVSECAAAAAGLEANTAPSGWELRGTTYFLHGVEIIGTMLPFPLHREDVPLYWPNSAPNPVQLTHDHIFIRFLETKRGIVRGSSDPEGTGVVVDLATHHDFTIVPSDRFPGPQLAAYLKRQILRQAIARSSYCKQIIAAIRPDMISTEAALQVFGPTLGNNSGAGSGAASGGGAPQAAQVEALQAANPIQGVVAQPRRYTLEVLRGITNNFEVMSVGTREVEGGLGRRPTMLATLGKVNDQAVEVYRFGENDEALYNCMRNEHPDYIGWFQEGTQYALVYPL